MNKTDILIIVMFKKKFTADVTLNKERNIYLNIFLLYFYASHIIEIFILLGNRLFYISYSKIYV